MPKLVTNEICCGKEVRGKVNKREKWLKYAQVASTDGRRENKIFVFEIQGEVYMGVKKMFNDRGKR